MSQAAHNPLNTSTGPLQALLARDRVATDVKVSSKKRMLEELAELLSRQLPGMDQHTVFSVLNERERLGSTGIGHGVALPHGRLNGISEPIAAAMQLRQPLDFDAIDDEPITLAIGLLVPAEATDQHLRILSDLASAFSDSNFRRGVFAATDTDALHRLLT
ncbi:MAG: hypothetical protein CL395_03980 [Acidiferrobacteraceae bacterium]|jgi:PTS system nitrogen regulatory IIA component|nr:hypothetical protein [Acidiferrobacteraceae bacterium]MCP4828151.1 PTS transporter subunit EIIA [Pseudomonadota bacterium]MDP6950153.1 PTS sugar transporter subunit IIA [Arenicellales bacterium]HJP06010.1 PTS sugar transporter subunit IIA [Arenicellales bacterium]|tara:strand:- start:2744 stop:3226 length:483 start_codon:yes stop_codon:yes gene_type:complete